MRLTNTHAHRYTLCGWLVDKGVRWYWCVGRRRDARCLRLLVPVNGALLHADEQPATRYCFPENPQIWCVLSEPSGGARAREREGGTSRAALWSNDCRRIQIDEMLVLIQGVQALGGWTLGGQYQKDHFGKQKNGESLREL